MRKMTLEFKKGELETEEGREKLEKTLCEFYGVERLPTYEELPESRRKLTEAFPEYMKKKQN